MTRRLKLAGEKSGRPDVHPSSRPVSDEALLPSRISREKLTLRLLPQGVRDARIFCLENRDYDLQDVVDIGIQLFLARVAEERGRPDAQTPSRPDDRSDQNLIPDQKQMNRSTDQTSNDQLNAQPLIAQICKALGEGAEPMPKEAIENYFLPIEATVDHGSRTVIMRACDRFMGEWASSMYSTALDRALGRLGYEQFDVQWVLPIAETAGPATTETGPPTALEMKAQLLDFYSIICENRLTPADEDSFLKVSECSVEAIKAGILRSRLSTMKRGERVGRFAYCVKAIWQIHNAGLARRELLNLEEEYYERRPQQASLLGRVRDISESE